MNWFDEAKEFLDKWKLRQKAAADYWDIFTPRVKRVFALAHEEAKQMKVNFIGTELLLIGLIELGSGVAVNVLKNLGLSLEAVRAEVKRQIGVGPEESALDYVPMNPCVMRVLDIAKMEAKTLGHAYVGTEHLLLGLLAENDGVVWRIFKMAGIDHQKTRQAILDEITPKFS